MFLELNDDDLQIIKYVELEIAKEIRRICTNHGIKYSIGFGTLLGAVRHGGFIPWDDDIDMFMKHDEYDKFLSIAPKEIDNRFIIVNYETDNNCGEPFTKVMMKDTIMLEVFARNTKAPCGVFVDVLSYDNRPNSHVSALIQAVNNYQLRKRILLQSNYSFEKHGIKKVIYNLLKLTTKCSRNKLVKQYRLNQKKYNGRITDKVVVLGSRYGYEKDSIPAKWLDEYTTIVFEGEEFMTIKEYIKFLEHYYGDYMKLPPIENRANRHRVYQLDLTHYGGRRAITTMKK